MIALKGIARVNNKTIKALKLRRPDPSDLRSHRRNLRGLWDAFTTHIYDEVSGYGQCSIVAQRRGDLCNLHLEAQDGHRTNTISDPLRIAQRMVERGLYKITFTETEDAFCDASSIEKALLAVLSEGFSPIPETGVAVLGNFFVDQATETGLPVLTDTSYVVLETPSQEMTPAEFRAALRQTDSAPACLAIFNERVVPYHEKSELAPFAQALLAKAKRFNEYQQDLDSAIIIWEGVYHADISPSDNNKTVLIMMDVANQYARQKEDRDITASIKLWVAVYNFNHSEGQNRITIRTMMDVANKLIDHTAPKDSRDVDSSVKIWVASHGLNVSQKHSARVVKTMMDVANKLARLDDPKEAIYGDVESALKVWDAAYRFNIDENGKLRVAKTIHDVAAKYKELREELTVLLEREKRYFADAHFYGIVLCGLYYFADDFERVLGFIDTQQGDNPSFVAMKADTLRKLKRYDESVKLCSGVIEEYTARTPLTLFQVDALVQAFCCRGYSYYENGRQGGQQEELWPAAISDFDRAIMISEVFRLPVPPRAHSGRGFVFRSMGEEDKAVAAFSAALAGDKDNVKALRQLERGS